MISITEILKFGGEKTCGFCSPAQRSRAVIAFSVLKMAVVIFFSEVLYGDKINVQFKILEQST
jgi:hypothetical protein